MHKYTLESRHPERFCDGYEDDRMAFELDTFVHFLLAAVTTRSITSAPRPHPACRKTAYSQPRLPKIYLSSVGRNSRPSRLSRSPVIQFSSGVEIRLS